MTEEEPSKEKSSEEEPSKEKSSEEEPSKEKSSEEEPSKEKSSKEKSSKEEPSKEKSSKEEPSEEKSSKEEPSEKMPSKRSGKYLLKSKKAEIRTKRKARPEKKETKESPEQESGSAEGETREEPKTEERAEDKKTEESTEEKTEVPEPESRIPLGWTPKTRLGRLVANREITTMKEAQATNLPLREPEIVEILLPELEDEVIDVNMVQRMTDSGRRVSFTVTCAVGNGDGFIGLGRAKGKEVGPTIQKAIDNAKLHIIHIRRACGSWECGCMLSHTVPFQVTGKCGSAEVTLKPAPQGVELAIGEVGKKILKLAGIKDTWSFTRGQTRTTVNFAYAVFDALKETIKMRVLPSLQEELQIAGGRT